ncbi:Regulator of microtubule dynamics protein 1 [Holothuria leucospilota]|uniref:Regulator of microtubule dynamics protein 1 n=1 Tax=Holothuria leucospilota TaxID=206669 RepID=A0A9Q1HDX2_HOLLE|nr:Regulator of microtubule dynamics protein 1 [Holothuria leucospilota]
MASPWTIVRSFGRFLRYSQPRRSAQRVNRAKICTSLGTITSRRRLGLGTFLTSSLVASRGFSLWSSPSQPEAEPVPSTPSPEELIIEEADKLYHSYEIESLYNHLLQHKDTNNDEILWRLARSSRDVANLASTTPDDKKRLTYETLEYTKRALALNDANYACHKWYAICLSDVGDYEGVKQKISNAFIIKEHFEKAIELNPKDATSVHLLGLWCFTFADMPWYQSKIAAVVFATPPTSTYEEALEKFLKAEEINPNFYSKNFLMIGKTYSRLGNTKMALLYLTKAKDAPARKEEEYQTRKEAIELLKGLGVKS